MCLLDCIKLIVHLVSTHYTEHKWDVQIKYLANSLAFVYNFYSPDYNSFELAEGYGWKELLFCVYPFCKYYFYCFISLLEGKQSVSVGVWLVYILRVNDISNYSDYSIPRVYCYI